MLFHKHNHLLMKSKDTPQNIYDQIKEYLETRYTLLKYEAIEQGSSVLSRVITDVVLLVVFTIVLVFLSITLALFLGKLLGSNWAGFGCITILYFFISLFQRIFKINIENVLIRTFVQKLFKKQNETQREG